MIFPIRKNDPKSIYINNVHDLTCLNQRDKMLLICLIRLDEDKLGTYNEPNFLAMQMRVSVSTVYRGIASLINHGLIYKSRDIDLYRGKLVSKMLMVIDYDKIQSLKHNLFLDNLSKGKEGYSWEVDAYMTQLISGDE